MGVELFPSLVNSIHSMKNPHKTIAIVYDENDHQANIVAQQLNKFLTHPTEVMNVETFLQRKDIGLVFLCAPELVNKQVISHSQQYGILSFSPFLQSVQLGTDTGLIVKEQVRPVLNKTSLQNKHISFKPFFVRVSYVYE